MKRRKKKQLQMMALLLGFFVLIAIVIVLIIVGISKLMNRNTLESIALTPDFAQTELDVNQDFSFTINTKPEKAKIKPEDVEVIPESTLAEITVLDNGTVAMHTIGEGDLEFCLKVGDVNSNVVKFTIVDQAAKAAREAEQAAEEAARAAEEAAAAAAAEEEAQIPREAYVRTIDKVRIRKSPSTDSNDNIITTCEIGEVYKRLDTVDDWSRIVYDEGEAYIKSEFLEILSDEEAQEALEAQKNQSVEEALKQAEEQSKQATANDPVAAAAAEAAKAKQDAEKAAADAAAAEAAAAAQAAAAQAAAGIPVRCKDGTGYFTQAQVNYFHGLWDYTGEYEEMVSHHSIGELQTLCANNGIQ